MMKNESIDVRLFNIEGDLVPFVEVDYLDKQNRTSKGVLLLDSGSTDNILSKDVAEKAGNICKLEGRSANIQSIANETVCMEIVNFSFCMGEHSLRDVFCIAPSAFP